MASPNDEIQKFYYSKEWKKVRRLAVIKANGLCARCGKVGKEVHHKIPLTPSNYKDTSIALNLDNLELLCTSCHNKMRYTPELRHDLDFDEDGNVIKKGTPHLN